MNQFPPSNSPIVATNWVRSLWKFSRPHTIIGTTLSVLGLYLLTIGVTNSSFSVVNLSQILITWLACISGNIYIVGLNQLIDVDIDKINKPHLPVAAGEFSEDQGKSIVITTGILALALAWISGPFLLVMVVTSLVIGTAYSLPPLRLKQFPFWAALCIFSVRGTIVNLGLFLHFSWLLQRSQGIPFTLWTLTLFILVFTMAIAIFKDIPDLEGDLRYNINTFTIKLGKKAVFDLALWLLTFCYIGMIIVGIFQLAEINPTFLVISHTIPLIFLWLKSQKVNLESKKEIAKFYQLIWKMFFLEYLIFPISALLN